MTFEADRSSRAHGRGLEPRSIISTARQYRTTLGDGDTVYTIFMLVEFERSVVLYGGKVLLVALGQPAVVLDLLEHLPVLVS